MKTFGDLLGPNDRSWCTSLAYWLGTHPRGCEDYTAQSVLEAMSEQYDREDQAFSPEDYQFVPEVNQGTFQPVSPVTLTHQWCPLPMACELLGEPAWWEIWDEYSPIGVVARWLPPASETLSSLESFRAGEPHAGHFLFLLRLAAMRALERGHALLLSCQPGWSYDTAVANPMGGVAGMAALAAGRLYTERVASGAFPIRE